jgi:hypothetical protein
MGMVFAAQKTERAFAMQATSEAIARFSVSKPLSMKPRCSARVAEHAKKVFACADMVTGERLARISAQAVSGIFATTTESCNLRDSVSATNRTMALLARVYVLEVHRIPAMATGYAAYREAVYAAALSLRGITQGLNARSVRVATAAAIASSRAIRQEVKPSGTTAPASLDLQGSIVHLFVLARQVLSFAVDTAPVLQETRRTELAAVHRGIMDQNATPTAQWSCVTPRGFSNRRVPAQVNVAVLMTRFSIGMEPLATLACLGIGERSAVFPVFVQITGIAIKALGHVFVMRALCSATGVVPLAQFAPATMLELTASRRMLE